MGLEFEKSLVTGNDMIDGQYVSDHYGILTYITINK